MITVRPVTLDSPKKTRARVTTSSSPAGLEVYRKGLVEEKGVSKNSAIGKRSERNGKKPRLEEKGGWQELINLAIAKGKSEIIKRVIDAERLWRATSQVKSGQLAGVKRELTEMKKQLTLSLVSLGVGTTEQETEIKYIINTKKERVDEEKRKEKKVKKIKRRKKEVKAEAMREGTAQKEAEKVAIQVIKIRESQ
ncbi:hypothetical protein EV426DRAFT_707421 [Tirmania nivea]|nr:hypothetical protein EV426DRAFT_707421 [Tirmania nivea]